MKTSNFVALTAGALCAVALIADATAGNNYGTNRKIMTGAQCQPSTGSQWPDFIVNPEGIRNMNTAYRYVSCAIVFDGDDFIDTADNDATTSAGGITIEVGVDYSTVGTGNYQTDCTLIRRNYDGTRTTSAASYSGTKAPGTTYFYLDTSILNGLDPFNPDTVSFNCRLPYQVRLTYLKTYENENTGGYYYTP